MPDPHVGDDRAPGPFAPASSAAPRGGVRPPPTPGPTGGAAPTGGAFPTAAPAPHGGGPFGELQLVEHRVPATGGRHRGRRRVLAVVGMAVVALLLSASMGYAALTRRDAQRNFRAAEAWRAQAEQAQRTVAQQGDRLAGAEADVARLRQEVADLTAARDAATEQTAGTQALLDDATRRLAEAEERVAELAGAQARAGDQAVLGR